MSLAILGNPPTIDRPFKRYNPIGQEEIAAATAVIESGVLSQFLGCWDPDFYGGPKVQAFERAWEEAFQVSHAVSFNSLTSGLIAAVGALDIEPGDEVIVSPWTMCATATAVLHWNAIPVFADIDPDTYTLDPKAVEACISPYTKAIIATDIFGQACDMEALIALADKYQLKLISDTAQAPGTYYQGKATGTWAHIGGYSLNYHKHIHTGEGGVMVTNDPHLAERMQLIRNHAEAVVEGKGVTHLANMVGHNFRLGEIEAAIGIEQLKKLAPLVADRQRIADRLTAGLQGLKGLHTPIIRTDATHAFYIYPMRLDLAVLPVSRQRLHAALEAEGITGLGMGYVNVHLLPMYQHKIAYGTQGFPWTAPFCRREINYAKGICPVAEYLHAESYLGFEMCLHALEADEVDLIIAAFQKVWAHLDQL